jgi:hypothetical protein
MNVTMKVQISGTRDGQDWPAPGTSIDLPDDEAAQLLALGLATEGSDDDHQPATDSDSAPAASPAEPEADTDSDSAPAAAPDEAAVAPKRGRK